MDHVQEQLSAGGNGRGDRESGGAEKRTEATSDQLVRGLIGRLSRGRRNRGAEDQGGTKPYPDEEMDVPGLEVPERDEQ